MLEMTGNNESLTFQIVTFTEMQEAREREVVKDLEDLFNSRNLDLTVFKQILKNYTCREIQALSKFKCITRNWSNR